MEVVHEVIIKGKGKCQKGERDMKESGETMIKKHA